MAQLTISDELAQRFERYLQQSDKNLEETLELVLSGLSLANPALLSILTHDLRTPLASIMTSSDIIRTHNHILTEQQRQEHLVTIQMQVAVANDMIDNLVVIQKYELNTLLFEPRLSNPGDLCRSVIDEINLRTYHSHHLTLEVDAGANHGFFDHKLLRLALIQVLTNAVRYSPEQSAIMIRCTSDEDHTLIEVTDEGMGIPESEVQQVTELFYRASNSQRIPGKGLGLAVVQRIMALHNGSLAVSSQQGQGTTVTMKIPRPYESPAF